MASINPHDLTDPARTAPHEPEPATEHPEPERRAPRVREERGMPWWAWLVTSIGVVALLAAIYAFYRAGQRCEAAPAAAKAELAKPAPVATTPPAPSPEVVELRRQIADMQKQLKDQAKETAAVLSAKDKAIATTREIRAQCDTRIAQLEAKTASMQDQLKDKKLLLEGVMGRTRMEMSVFDQAAEMAARTDAKGVQVKIDRRPLPPEATPAPAPAAPAKPVATPAPAKPARKLSAADQRILDELDRKIRFVEKDLERCRYTAATYTGWGQAEIRAQADDDAATDERQLAELRARRSKLLDE